MINIISSPISGDKNGFGNRHIFIIEQTETQVGSESRRFGYQLLYPDNTPMTKPESTQTTDDLHIHLDFTEILRSKVRTNLRYLEYDNQEVEGYGTPEMEIEYKFKYWEIIKDNDNCTITVSEAVTIDSLFLVNTTENVDKLTVGPWFNIYPSVFYDWNPKFIIPVVTSSSFVYSSYDTFDNITFNGNGQERRYIHIHPQKEGKFYQHDVSFGCGDFDYFLFQSIKGGISAFSAEIVNRLSVLDTTPLFKYAPRTNRDTPTDRHITMSGNTIQLNSAQENLIIRKEVQIHDENDMRYYEDFVISPRIFWIPNIGDKIEDLRYVSLIPTGQTVFFVRNEMLTIERQFAISRDKTLPSYQ